MIDRFGNTVWTGWSEIETLWVRAAITLPQAERLSAFEDIAKMAGRTVADVTAKARRTIDQDREAARLVLSQIAATRTVMVPQRCLTGRPGRLPSALAPPSRALLMGGRAVPAKTQRVVSKLAAGTEP